MSDALQVSSDVYFFSLGLRAQARAATAARSRTGPQRYGLGQQPGDRHPGCERGLIPTPAWRTASTVKGSNPYIDRPGPRATT